MSAIKWPELPEPDHATAIEFGCDGRWYTAEQMRDYAKAVAEAALEALVREMEQ